MRPQEKGWLKEYLEFRKDLLKDLAQKRGSHPEHSLYSIIQPTGIMYGHTVGYINHPDSEQWDDKDKMKILLAESLISSSLLFYNKPVRTPEELSQGMKEGGLQNISIQKLTGGIAALLVGTKPPV